jgi:Cdc6-like AAA superfamily ATPase
MPSLSFEKTKEAKPVAIVRGGDKDGEVLYLHTDERKGAKKEVKAVRYMKELSFLKPAERVQVMNKIVEGVSKDTPSDSIAIPDKAKDIYKRIQADTSSDKSIEIGDDSLFVPIPSPDPKTRQIWYVAGQSGSGKSYFARNIAENYKKLYPDREIFLISKLTEDETLDNMKVGKPKRINIETILTDPIDLEECKDCLIIADDWDTITPKPLYDAIHKLIEDICIMGRHSNTSLCILSHHLTNYKSTRLMLNEAHFLVLYPLATSHKALKYVSELYGNCDAEEIKKFKRRGRWVLIHKCFPGYIISSHEANVLNC